VGGGAQGSGGRRREGVGGSGAEMGEKMSLSRESARAILGWRNQAAPHHTTTLRGAAVIIDLRDGGNGGGGGSGGGGGEREAAGHIDYPRRVVCYRTTRMSDVTADLPINALSDRRFLRIPPGGLIFNRCLITVQIARHFDPIT